MFMLYSLSPPRILISSCQPLTSLSSLAHPSPISASIFLSFFFYHSFFIAHSLPSILLQAGPSAPLLFDVSLIPPCLSTVVISSIFQCYPQSLPPHLSHFPCPPFLSSLSILLSLLLRPIRANIFLPFPLLFLEYVIFHTSWHHQSSISHWPCIHPDINQLVLVSWSPIFTHLIQQSWNILIYSL